MASWPFVFVVFSVIIDRALLNTLVGGGFSTTGPSVYPDNLLNLVPSRGPRRALLVLRIAAT